VLFREGDRARDFMVILSGAITVVDHEAGVERELVTIGPGRFVAELNILTGERVFATVVVREPGSVLVVPADSLQEVIAQDQGLSDLIVQTSCGAGNGSCSTKPAWKSLARSRHRTPGGCGISRPATTGRLTDQPAGNDDKLACLIGNCVHDATSFRPGRPALKRPSVCYLQFSRPVVCSQATAGL
jgi:hypothetical protein